MKKTTTLLAALSEPPRLRAMQILSDGKEHCVCELMKDIQISQSRMSRHMGYLKKAGLVTDRRDAQWVRYRAAVTLDKTTQAMLSAVLSHISGQAEA